MSFFEVFMKGVSIGVFSLFSLCCFSLGYSITGEEGGSITKRPGATTIEGSSGSSASKKDITTPEGKTVKEVTIEGANEGKVSAYALGTTANGVMIDGFAVTSPDHPVTFEAPETLSIVIDLPSGNVVAIEPGEQITIPAGTTISAQNIKGDVTVTTSQRWVYSVPGQSKPVVIPEGTSFTIPSGTIVFEASNPNGLTNFEEATGWTTSTIIKGENGTLFLPQTPRAPQAPAGS